MQLIVYISFRFLPLKNLCDFRIFIKEMLISKKLLFLYRRKWLKDASGKGQHFTENLIVWRIIEAICGMNTSNRFVLITYSHEGLCTLKSKGEFSRRLIEVRACIVGAWYADASAVYYPRRESWAFVPFVHTVRGSSRLLTLNTGSVSGSGCAGCNYRRVLLCGEKG